MAKSTEFHWVTVNRDHTPEIPKRLNVSAYPSLLVLGANEENVHRFQSYMKADELLAELADGTRRWELFANGEAWDAPRPRAPALTGAVSVRTFAAPAANVPAGMFSLGGALWIAHMGELHRLDAETNSSVARFELPRSALDVATDGTHIYALESGWTAGKPIHVIDPADGSTVRTITTAANATQRAHGAKGIAFHDGRLLVLEGMHGRIHELDPDTGDVRSTIQSPERWLTSLASDGEHLVTGSREALLWLDATTGEVVRRLEVAYPLRSVGVHDGAVHVMEQPVFGFDRAHRRVQVWPTETLVYRLGR